jgi:hypothetical protein
LRIASSEPAANDAQSSVPDKKKKGGIAALFSFQTGY